MKAKLTLLTFLASAVVVTLAVYYQFHLGNWSETLYYDGDNITLALVVKSIVEGESFRWVFSSQSFIFPEGPIYAVGHLLTHSYKNGLLVSAFLNFGIFLALCILLFRKLSFTWAKTYAVLATLLSAILIVLCLEFIPDVNRSTIFSLLFFQTYYVGVVLVSLFQLWLLLTLVESRGQRKIGLAIFFVLVGGLTYASNPLYLLQFLMPVSLVAGYLFLRCRQRVGLQLLGLTALTLICGLVIQSFLSQFLAAKVGSYINPSSAFTALINLKNIVINASGTPSYLALWLLWMSLYGLYAWYSIKQTSKKGTQHNISFLLVHGFLLCAPPIIVFGVIASGNVHTRYLLPIPVYILLGASIALNELWSSRIVCIFSGGCLFFGAAFFSYQIGQAAAMPSADKMDIVCFDEYSKVEPVVALSGYWNARHLQLYGSKEGRIYQAHKDFSPLNWLSNKQDHRSTQVNAVIVSKINEQGFISTQDVNVLGDPSAIHTCIKFDIYRYAADSKGYRLLNERIRGN